MATTIPRPLIEISYYQSAQEYLRSLPPEHFMEAMAQGKQREITLESLALVRARRPDVQVFNELLVQYPGRAKREIRKVVPDNMVVIHSEPIVVDGSYDIPLQPVGPFWVLEYVSKHNSRKDYEDNHDRYEKELKVPYFLLFYPDTQDLTLYHYTGRRFSSVKPNENDRLAVPELEIEVALLDEWVRFWFRGELLPLPGDMLKELDQIRGQLAETRRNLSAEREARLAAERELERLRAQIEASKGA